jgi:hypothetical protein
VIGAVFPEQLREPGAEPDFSRENVPYQMRRRSAHGMLPM